MSLYYFSETTFINLQHLSRNASVEYYFRTFDKKDNFVNEQVRDILIKTLNPSSHMEIQEVAHIFETKFGKVTLQPALIKTPFFSSPNGKNELKGWILNESDYLTPQLEDGDLPYFDQAFSEVEKAPVVNRAIRVNVEVPTNTTLLRDLMVNFYRRENRPLMEQEPNIHIKEEYSNGFLDVLLSEKRGILAYNPSLQQLYDDYIIRQFVEIVGKNKNVWEESIDKVRSKFMEITGKKDFEMPLFGFDITGILLSAFPEDLVTKRLSKWIKPSKSVQFREFFGSVDKAVRSSVGFVKVTEMFGPIVSDSALSQVSFIETSLIKAIRKRLEENDKKTFIIKYIVWDSETCPQVYKEKHKDDVKFYQEEDILLGHIPTNVYGTVPFIVPGESIIWHQRTEHRFNFLAKYNPSLINFNLLHLLENKYIEYLWWQEYCPGFLPKTQLLYNLLPQGQDPNNVSPDLFVELANQTYPEGWIIKGIWDYNGILHVTTHKSNFVDMINNYRKSTFGRLVERYKKNLPGCEPIEDLNLMLKDEKHFKGWKNNQYLLDSTSCGIQEFKKPKREYRIECYGGMCPLDSMSDDFSRSHLDSSVREQEYRSKLNKFFMKCIKSLPKALQWIPLTSDLAEAEDGSKIVYETNPGGNSWLIHHAHSVATVHHKYLKQFPQRVQKMTQESRELQGMTPIEQIEYIKRMLKKWNISIEKASPRFKILRDRITDQEHIFMKQIDRMRMNYTGKPILPLKKVNNEQIYFTLARSLDYLNQSRPELVKKNASELLVTLNTFLSSSKWKKKHLKFLKTFSLGLQENVEGMFGSNQRTLHDLIQKYSGSSLSQKQVLSIHSQVGEIYPTIQLLKTLGLKHDKLFEDAETLLYLIYSQKSLPHSKLFKKGFDFLDSHKPQDFAMQLNDLTREKETLSEIYAWIESTISALKYVKSIEYRVKIYNSYDIAKTLIASIRPLTDELMRDHHTIKHNQALVKIFLKYSEMMIDLLKIIVSKDGPLDQEYKFERSFLNHVIPLAKDVTSYHIALIVDGLHLFSKVRKEEMEEIYFTLVYKQGKLGSWRAKENIGVLKMTTMVVEALFHGVTW